MPLALRMMAVILIVVLGGYPRGCAEVPEIAFRSGRTYLTILRRYVHGTGGSIDSVQVIGNLGTPR